MESEQQPERLKSLNLAGEKRTLNTSYSRVIRWLRLILPLSAIAIIAALFSWVGFDNDPVITEQPKLENRKTAKNELLNPHFESTDNKNQPYSITAIRATQSDHDEKLVLLDTPTGEMKLNNGKTLKLDAQTGQYHQEEEKLKLAGDVILLYDKNYKLHSPEIHVNLQSAEAWSKQDIKAEGPLGKLNAKGFQMNGRTEKLTFQGPATVIINSEAL